MKIFANKNIWKKLVIVFLIITIFSFATPEPVAASFGGELMEPICDFLVAVCDGILNVLHQLLVDQDNAIIDINLSKGKLIAAIVVLVAVAIAVIVTVSTLGAAAGAAATAIIGMVSLAMKFMTFALGTTIVLGMVFTASDLATEGYTTEDLPENLSVGYSIFEWDWFDDEIGLPIYKISPEEIFRDTVSLFDVNFFSDEDKYTEYDPTYVSTWPDADWTKTWTVTDWDTEPVLKRRKAAWNAAKETPVESLTLQDAVDMGLIDDETKEGLENGSVTLSATTSDDIEYTWTQYYVLVNGPALWKYDYDGTETYGVVLQYEYYETYSDEYLKVMGMDESLRTTETTYYVKAMTWTVDPRDYIETVEIDNNQYEIAYYLQQVVSGWYYALLIVGIVGMLSVLVYIGIRILVSSVASEKAKYKQMLMDWLVGMILLFTMHYIMVFANTFVDLLTDYLNEGELGTYTLIIEDSSSDQSGKICKGLDDAGYALKGVDEDNVSTELASIDEDSDIVITYEADNANGKQRTYVVWNTNMMGFLRVCLSASSDAGAQYVGYTVLFIMMVVYTCMFVWIYIRRVIYMAFLTIIAPLVALTYPIDKANDGQAQGFNIWFKEYMFNLLLQPMHLLLYSILVSSAIELALVNPIYAIVALGFMVPAEKILRKLFNFSKAETPGVFGGVAGAALGMSAIKWLTGHGPKGKDGGGSGGAGGSSGTTDSSGKVYTARDGENKVSFAGVPSEDIAKGLKGTGTDGAEKVKDSDSEKPGDEPKGEVDKTKGIFAKKKTGNQEDKENKKKRLRKGAVWLNAYGSGIQNKLKRNLKNGKPIKQLNKAVWGAAAGMTLGTAGLALGATTGDGAKAFQYAGAGLAGGAKLGSGTAGAVSNALEVDEDITKRARMGEEAYINDMAEKAKKEAKENENYIRKVQEKLKIDDMFKAKERLGDMADFYYDNKITNIDDMISLEKVAEQYEKENISSNMANNRAAATIGLHLQNQYNISSRIGEEKRQQLEEQIKKDYKCNEERAQDLIRMADFYNTSVNNIH